MSTGNADSQRRLTKNEKRRLKKKQGKSNGDLEDTESDSRTHSTKPDLELEERDATDRDNSDPEIVVEYVSADVDVQLAGLDDALLNQFRGVFGKFTKPEDLVAVSSSKSLSVTFQESDQLAAHSENNEEDSQVPQQAALSKKKKKLLNRLSVAELKQLVARPDVVEKHDVSSSDPRLLVHLKSIRNTVPVPRHWSHIRKYLQGKRGADKVPYQLPEFIADTGIAKIREAIMEQEEMKKGKQKARERIRPKMGKIDIDYQVLHDAFFKYQTKPKISMHGDIYYEGREFEVHLKEKTPGVLSAELISALGMQDNAPPPWLVNMQRYGPPPSYPQLRIPGLNAPIPSGASYGFHPGGWGKPPVDEYGRPLYGDVFGTGGSATSAIVTANPNEAVDKDYRWGAIEFEEEVNDMDDDEEEEEEEEEDDDDNRKDHRRRQRLDQSGLETPMSIDGASLATGMETPDTIDLRKREGFETPDTLAHQPRELYQVIKETRGAIGAQAIFGSERQYSLPGKGDVQLSINPEDLEDTLGNRDRLKDLHEASQSANTADLLYGKGSIGSSFTKETAESEAQKAERKRKAEAPLVYKKAKEFKF